MSYTRSHLGALILSFCSVLACSQKDPNDGLNQTTDTSDTDDSDTTEDTSDATTSTHTSNGTTTNVEPDTAATSSADSSQSDDADATESTEADASSPTDAADTETSDTDTADTETSDTADTETSDTDSSDDLDEQICPMVAGATWTYKHKDWIEVQTVTTTNYDGEAGYIVKDTPDPEDNLRADTVLIKRDGRLLRIYKEQYWVNPNNDQETLDSKATYGVGFVRCDEAWATKDVGWNETPEYVRVETVGDDPAKAPEERSHTFTMEGREDLSTSNGETYTNCLKVRRSKDWAAVESAEDAQEKLYWFCPGVGKVREQNVESGNFEELLEYSIPE